MSQQAEKQELSPIDSVESKADLFRTLPVEIVDQIITDLPFNSIIALLAAKERHVTECILHSSSYGKVFRGVKDARDLWKIADIINFCYEISSYRLTTDELCRTHKSAAKDWHQHVQAYKNRTFQNYYGNYLEFMPCDEQEQERLYRQGSMRAARWNRTIMHSHANHAHLKQNRVQSTPAYVAMKVEAQQVRFGERNDVLYIWKENAMSRRSRRILHRIQSEIQLDTNPELYYTTSCKEIVDAVDAASLSIECSEMVHSKVDISAGIDEFIRNLDVSQVAVNEKVLTRIKQILMDQPKLQFCRDVSRSSAIEAYRFEPAMPRHLHKSILYTVPSSCLAHIFFEEVLKDIVGIMISDFAIKKLEKRIHQKMLEAPISSYWFFHDYFKQLKSPSERFENVLFSERDHRLFDDGHFWWDSSQAAFQVTRSNQLLELGDLVEKYPFMLIRDADPGSEARANFVHIMNTIKGRARRTANYNPFAKNRPKLFVWLTECPGLPLLPLQKHLSFFLDMVAQHPLDVGCITDLTLAKEVLRVNEYLQNTFSLPSLVCGELDPHHQEKAPTNPLCTSSPVAVSREPANPAHPTLQSRNNIYPEEILQQLATTIQGLAFIHRSGSASNPYIRLENDPEDNATITFSRWRKGTDKYVQLNREEKREPFHPEDMEWILAFLKSCVYFKDTFLNTAITNTTDTATATTNTTVNQHIADRWADVFEPPPTKSHEERETIKQARRQRKQARKAARLDRRARKTARLERRAQLHMRRAG